MKSIELVIILLSVVNIFIALYGIRLIKKRNNKNDGSYQSLIRGRIENKLRRNVK